VFTLYYICIPRLILLFIIKIVGYLECRRRRYRDFTSNLFALISFYNNPLPYYRYLPTYNTPSTHQGFTTARLKYNNYYNPLNDRRHRLCRHVDRRRGRFRHGVRLHVRVQRRRGDRRRRRHRVHCLRQTQQVSAILDHAPNIKCMLRVYPKSSLCVVCRYVVERGVG